MKTLFTILIALFVLIFIVPLSWLLIKELVFFFGLAVNGWALVSFIFFIILIIALVKIFD